MKVSNNDQKTLEVLNNDQRLSETLTRLKTSNGVTRFQWLKKSRNYFLPHKFKEIKLLIKLFLPVILKDAIFPISLLPAAAPKKKIKNLLKYYKMYVHIFWKAHTAAEL